MQWLKQLIDKATLESEHDYEVERRKVLENFLKSKRVKRAEDFKELIQA